MNKLILLYLCFFQVPSLLGADFEGVYSGYVEDLATQNRTDLQIRLDLVQDISHSQAGQLSKLAGAFVVDGEGGPYEFSNVSLDIDTSLFVMNYLKPQIRTIPGLPADLQFIGSLQDAQTIRGKVLSGRKGEIARFVIRRENTKLVRVPKHIGEYLGQRILGETGETSQMKVFLAPSPSHSINPVGFDLDYSHGKIGYVEFSGGIKYSLSKVHIDYLQRKVTLIHHSTNSDLTLRAKINKEGDLVDGVIESTLGGRVGSFSLNKTL